MKVVRIGTRGSRLALAQAHWVRRQLEGKYRDARVEVVAIKTRGDSFVDLPIKAVGGKGIFVKEIEAALLNKRIDLAVHSMKDVPTEIAPQLTIAAIPEREDPTDVFVSIRYASLKDLPSGATVGTGSLRRRAQILHFRSDLAIVPIRGNIDTRLKKLEQGETDALVLALAGLKRIGCEERAREYLPPEICLSAVAQGALGLESREGDAVIDQIDFLHHPQTAAEVRAERSFLGRLGGGCQIPVAARAWVAGEEIRLMGLVADIDGHKLIRDEMAGRVREAGEVGSKLAERLLQNGAGQLLGAKETHVAHGSR